MKIKSREKARKSVEIKDGGVKGCIKLVLEILNQVIYFAHKLGNFLHDALL